MKELLTGLGIDVHSILAIDMNGKTMEEIEEAIKSILLGNEAAHDLNPSTPTKH